MAATLFKKLHKHDWKRESLTHPGEISRRQLWQERGQKKHFTKRRRKEKSAIKLMTLNIWRIGKTLKIKHKNWDRKLYIQHDSNFVIQLCIFLKKILRGVAPKLVGLCLLLFFFFFFYFFIPLCISYHKRACEIEKIHTHVPFVKMRLLSCPYNWHDASLKFGLSVELGSKPVQ